MSIIGEGIINYEGINIGWNYKARNKKGFRWADNTSKAVWGSGGDDDNITGYAQCKITNQEDYTWDYDNEPE